MIYAIAMSNNKLSHKFSKSEQFKFYNEQKEPIAVYKNPAIGVEGCSGKQSIVALFHKMKCDSVIVRKVGEKTLARLLNAGFKVEQGNTRNTIEQLLDEASIQKNPLTEPEQGVKSSCDHSHNHNHESDQCCGNH